jgi:hypothetical protein
VLFVPPEIEPWVSEGKVRRVWWEAVADAACEPKAGKPTIRMQEATVGAEDLHHLLGRAAHITLYEDAPNRARETIAQFGVEGFKGSHQRVEWDPPVPVGVRTIAIWHSRARGIFERCLAASRRAHAD